MRVELDTPLKKVLAICFYICLVFLYKRCTFPDKVVHQVDSILQTDPQIQAEYGKVKHYKYFGKMILYNGGVNDPISYIYHIKVEGEKKQGEIELKIYKFPEQTPKPYIVELKDE